MKNSFDKIKALIETPLPKLKSLKCIWKSERKEPSLEEYKGVNKE
jgi:preprotein translocase subunit Sss1